MIYDMHCHMDFAADARVLAEGAREQGIAALSATVEPGAYVRLREELASFPQVNVGLGLHPWRIAEGGCREDELSLFEELAPGARIVGEIGLDFAGSRGEEASRRAQVAALERILAACERGSGGSDASRRPDDAASGRGKLLSLHAARAAGAVLDLLERTGALARHTCIIHWFSGTSDELARAVKCGCFFSVGPRMLATRRGRAYAQAIPENRLLLETDAPPAPAAEAGPTPWDAALWRTDLESVLTQLATLRRTDKAALATRIARTSAELLGGTSA